MSKRLANSATNAAKSLFSILCCKDKKAREDIIRANKKIKELETKVDLISRVGIADKAKPQNVPISVPMVEFTRVSDIHLACPACSQKAISHASAYPSNESRFRMAIVLYCSRCGTGFVPDGDKILSGFYESEYANSNRRDRGMPPQEYFHISKPGPKMRRYFGRAKAQVTALAELGAKFDRVLDYGSGPGYFLFECAAKYPFAVELDGESDKYLEYLGAKKLDPANLDPNSMDVIVASHVVEHFTDQNLDENLNSMVDALSDEGLLLIEVPHGGHSYVRLGARQDPHTIFFTPEGIYKAVERTGVKIIKSYARSVEGAAKHTSQIYFPDMQNEFFSTMKGGLTIIAKK